MCESRIISSACFHPDDDVHWGKANFELTHSFPGIWGCLYKNTCLPSTNCKGPWISNFRDIFYMLVKNFIIPMKNQKVMFFRGPDAGSLLSGTVKRSSEARCLARLNKRQNIWSHFSRHDYLQQDVRSYSITQYSIDQIVNSIFQTILTDNNWFKYFCQLFVSFVSCSSVS